MLSCCQCECVTRNVSEGSNVDLCLLSYRVRYPGVSPEQPRPRVQNIHPVFGVRTLTVRFQNLFHVASQPASQPNPPSHFVLNTLLETCTATLYVLLRVRNTQNVQCPVGGVPRGCGVRAGRGGAVAGRWQRRWGGVLSVF